MTRLKITYYLQIDHTRKISQIALVVFLISAFFSIGHHASDEHFQILEFAQYKLGLVDASGLAWEFHEQMRPSLQPWMAYCFIRLFKSIGIHDPFLITLVFRLMSALLAWLVITKLNTLLNKKYFPDRSWSLLFYLFTYLLWFVPYISVRFSSENFSGIFLMAGVYLLLKDRLNTQRAFLTGIFLGLSILFRYQTALAVAGLGAWMIFIMRARLAILLPVIAGGMLVMAGGAYLDYLFYGDFELTTVNYFRLNLVDDKASEFGVKPFWFYFTYFLLVVLPPLSIILLFSFFNGLKELSKHAATWLLIPFLLVHILIPHKEIRFLFPVFYFFSFLAAYGLMQYFKKRPVKRWHRRVLRTGLVINLIVLVVRMVLPANEKIYYYKYLYNNFEKADYLLMAVEKNGYIFVGNLRASFYEHPQARSLHFGNYDLMKRYLDSASVKKFFLLQRNYAPVTIPGYHMEKVYSIYPAALKKIGSVDLEKRVNPWSIHLVQVNTP